MSDTKSLSDLKLLGLKVRDRVTGMSGIVESISYDLYGCIQAVVRPPADEKNEVKDGRWFDISRLEVVDATPVMAIPGERFEVDRTEKQPPVPTNTHGPAEKPHR